MLYSVHTCDLCDDLLCFNEMPTKLYGSAILPMAYRDYHRQCEIIYDAQSGSKTMRVKSSLSHWGCVTVNKICLRSSTKTASFLRNPGVRHIHFTVYTTFY